MEARTPQLPRLPDLRGFTVVSCDPNGPSGASRILELNNSLYVEKVLIYPEREHARSWIQAFAELPTPGTPKLVGVESRRDALTLLRDYVPGESLENFFGNGGAILPEDAAILFLRLAQVLRDIGATGLFHGRLKPSNIILRDDGVPFITETHIPFIRFHDLSVTRRGFLVESPQYLSPEQFNKSSTIDIRSDIFSLGSIFYRVAAGTHPFPGDTVAEIRDRICNCDPPEPRRVCPAVPQSLSNIIMKMLAKRPEARYQDADDLIQDLRNSRERSLDRPARAAPLPPPRSGRRLKASARTVAAGLAGLIIVALAALLALPPRPQIGAPES